MARHYRAGWTPKFSLRTGLVLFLVLGTSLGLGARFRQETWERCEAQKWLVGRGALGRTKERDVMRVSYLTEGKRSWFVSLMRKWVHPEYDRRIESISISRAGLTEEGADKISRVYVVHTLLLYGPTNEICLAKICTAPGLQSLYLDSRVYEAKEPVNWSVVQKNSSLERLYLYPQREFPESTVRNLSALPALAAITVHHGDLRDAQILASSPRLAEFNYYGLRDVRGYQARSGKINKDWNTEFRRVLDVLALRSELKRLRVFACDLRDPSVLRNFADKSNLKIAHLQRSDLSPESLAEIAKLKSLETLHLDLTPLSDRHFQILAHMKNLYGVHGVDPRLTREARQLEASLPHVRVNPP